MIRRLRNRFIRIATLSVVAVMLLLTVILNAANYISTDGDLRYTLQMICANQGTIPLTERDMAPPDDPQAPPEGEPGNAPQKPNDRNGPFTPETPFSCCAFRTTVHCWKRIWTRSPR